MAKRRTKKSSKSSARWRASWKGEVRFGLVRFTVEAINAHSRSGSDVHFHQLHAECHSRIEYQKVCPIHGEVDQSEIVLGYEQGRGRYIEIDPDELDRLRTTEERALTIEEFISPEALDEIYLDGRMYYLSPAEANDREPYHLMVRAMDDADRLGVGQVVFSGKKQLVALRTYQNVLVMEMLNYAPELRDAKALGISTERAKVSTQSLRLAKALITSLESERFSIEDYEDSYRADVKRLLNAKKKGEVVAEPETEEEGSIINLMDALKRSVGSKGKKKRAKRTSA